MTVPNVDFLSLNFANVPVLQGTSPAWIYTSPQYAVDKIVIATAAGGTILPIQAPAPNSSWTLDFPGPSLTCVNLQDLPRDNIIQNVANAMISNGFSNPYGYIAWTPDLTGIEPFIPVAANGSFVQGSTLRSGTLDSSHTPTDPPSNYSSSTATIFVATFPAIGNLSEEYCNQSNDKSNDIDCTVMELQNSTIIECGLYNTSYHADFQFIDGTQTVNITRAENIYNNIIPIYFLDSSGALGPLATLSLNGTVNGFNLTEVQTLAYQAVMDAFGGILVGTITNNNEEFGTVFTSNTSIMSTVLSETVELEFLSKYAASARGSLAQSILEYKSIYPGISASDTASYNLPLRQALEDLFQNTTISLMSSALLQ